MKGTPSIAEIAYRLDCWFSKSGRVLFLPLNVAGRVRDICLGRFGADADVTTAVGDEGVEGCGDSGARGTLPILYQMPILFNSPINVYCGGACLERLKMRISQMAASVESRGINFMHKRFFSKGDFLCVHCLLDGDEANRQCVLDIY